MTEYLKQVSEIGDDKVETTGKSLDSLALEDDKKSFDSLVKNLGSDLTKKIDDDGISDEIVSQIVKTSNEEISEMLNTFGNGTVGNFEEFNNQFNELFAGANLDQYISEVKAQNTLTQKTELKSGNLISNWVNKSANEMAKNNY